jgi:hypothetical protein
LPEALSHGSIPKRKGYVVAWRNAGGALALDFFQW